MVVLWPEDSDVYKVVQIYLNGTPKLLIGGSKAFHGEILDHKILREHNIECDWIGDHWGDSVPPREFSREATSELEAVSYQLVGAGRVDVSVEDRFARFFGDSKGYRIGINGSHLDKIRELEKDWVIEVDESLKEY